MRFDVGEDVPVPIDMVRVPAGGRAVEVMVDRRTGRTWTVEVGPFEIATTVVTVGQWSLLFGKEPEPSQSDFPKVEVSWRQAVSFCNELSLQEGLAPTYTITTIDAPARGRSTWTRHDEPAPDN